MKGWFNYRLMAVMAVMEWELLANTLTLPQ